MVDYLVVGGIIIVVAVWLTIVIVRAKRYGLESVANCGGNCQGCKDLCHDPKRKTWLTFEQHEKKGTTDKSKLH